MLEQKVAVVTGASRGIGRAIAEKLAEEGVFVVINYRGNEEQAKQVQQTIKEQGGNAGIYGCDVSDFSACCTSSIFSASFLIFLPVKHFLKM